MTEIHPPLSPSPEGLRLRRARPSLADLSLRPLQRGLLLAAVLLSPVAGQAVAALTRSDGETAVRAFAALPSSPPGGAAKRIHRIEDLRP